MDLDYSYSDLSVSGSTCWAKPSFHIVITPAVPLGTWVCCTGFESSKHLNKVMTIGEQMLKNWSFKRVEPVHVLLQADLAVF